jgi:hypothetical protein
MYIEASYTVKPAQADTIVKHSLLLRVNLYAYTWIVRLVYIAPRMVNHYKTPQKSTYGVLINKGVIIDESHSPLAISYHI